MRTRRIIAIVLAFVTLPLLVFGLIDPLEGGIALLVAIGLGVVVWALARVPLPKLLWISLIVTVVIGAITLGIAIFSVGADTGSGTAANPMASLRWLNWVWRAGVLVVAAGAVVYIVRLFRSLREPAVTA